MTSQMCCEHVYLKDLIRCILTNDENATWADLTGTVRMFAVRLLTFPPYITSAPTWPTSLKVLTNIL